MKHVLAAFLVAIMLPNAAWSQSAQTFEVRVIECIPTDSLESLRKEVLERLEDHLACGQNKASILLKSHHKLKVGEVQEAHNLSAIPFSGNRQKIEATPQGFSLSPEQFNEPQQSGVDLKIQFVGEEEAGLKVSAVATVTEWKSRERVSWFNEDKVYINTEPVKQQRFIVATGSVAQGGTEILAGDVWFSAPATQTTLKRLPEQARLWLEVRSENP